MNTSNFSNETIKSIVSTLNENEDEVKQLQELLLNSEVDFAEVGQRYLMDKLDMTQTEAEEVCAGIVEGVSEFEDMYQKNKESQSVNLNEQLTRATAEMDEEKKQDYLVSVLTTLQVLQGSELSTEEIEGLKEKNMQLSVADLMTEIEKLADGLWQLDQIGAYVKEHLDAEAIRTVASQVGKNKDEYKKLSALILYVLQSEGKLNIAEMDQPVSPQMLGSLACAGVEMIATTGALVEGEIELKDWQFCLKLILGALLGCAFLCLEIMVLVAFAIAFIDVFGAILGFSLVSCLLMLSVLVFLCYTCSDPIMAKVAKGFEFLSDLFDRYIQPVTLKVQDCVAFLKSLFSKEKKVDGEVVVEPEKEGQEQAVVTPVQNVVTSM